jgi:hypothetical protein
MVLDEGPVATETEPADDEALERLRDRLLGRLKLQREVAGEFYRWYRCQQDPPDMPAAADYRPPFQRLRKMARGAWARLVVDSIAERMVVQGVHTTVGEEADRQAWELLQANRIDSDQRDVHTESFITGISYASVAGDGDSVRITPETCLEVAHEPVPGDRRQTAAAIKLVGGDGEWLVELYTPGLVASWTTSYRDPTRTPLADRARAAWGDPVVVANGLGAVPFVPFENRPTAATAGLSELDELLPVMERIQELELAKLIGVYSVTFPQKWATGLAVSTERDPETGQVKPPFESGPLRLWTTAAADAKFGAFPSGDIDQYLKAVDDEIAELAAISRVPSYYFVQSNLANPPSAESLITSETGLVTKCVDRQASFGESWERIVRLAASAAGLAEIADDTELQIEWRSPERRNPAVIADAATKLQAIGIPTQALWSFVGYSPQAIDRMRVEAAAEALELAALAPAVPTPTEGGS